MAGAGRRDREKPNAEDQEPERGPGGGPPLTEAELSQLRKGCRNIRDQALVEFLSSSGCRLSEAAGLRAEQVNWKQRSVRVLGKGRKARTVFFSAHAGGLLREYLSQREGGEALFAAVRAPWTPLTPGGIEKALARIGQRAGLARRVHPHILRHTFATQALKGGMALPVIQQLLGHEDPKNHHDLRRGFARSGAASIYKNI